MSRFTARKNRVFPECKTAGAWLSIEEIQIVLTYEEVEIIRKIARIPRRTIIPRSWWAS
ncbi:MAG TPA: hypothetical protein VF074_05795 [Pyrinomonadaceae bacterium]